MNEASLPPIQGLANQFCPNRIHIDHCCCIEKRDVSRNHRLDPRLRECFFCLLAVCVWENGWVKARKVPCIGRFTFWLGGIKQ